MVLMNLFTGKEWRCRCRNSLVDTVGERESGTNGESSINIYTLSCVKYIAGEKLLYNTESPAWHSVMSGGVEGGGVSGEGRDAQWGRGGMLRREVIYV